jgi:ParB family transcriptional regulator, chromosome partitioning protein
MSAIMADLTHLENLEIGQLDLRYAHTRIRNPENLLPLVRSLEKWGQLRPVSVVPSAPPVHVLVDGYLRVEALKRCGQDMVLAEIWQCNEMEALVQVLRREQERRWEALEEASLIRELHERYELSQDKIANLLGKDKSWVCRRLALLCSLPDEVLAVVRSGRLSTWAAGRIMAPLARANPEHAKALTRILSQEHLSTRQLEDLFRHYRKANRRQREKMVLEPVLFLKALQAREEENRTGAIKEGPEGKWLKDMKTVGHILVRLRKDLPVVLYPGQPNLDRRLLLTAFEDTRNAFLSLEEQIRRCHAERRDSASDPEFEGKRCPDQADRPDPESLPQYGAPGAAGEPAGEAKESLTL